MRSYDIKKHILDVSLFKILICKDEVKYFPKYPREMIVQVSQKYDCNNWFLGTLVWWKQYWQIITYTDMP